MLHVQLTRLWTSSCPVRLWLALAFSLLLFFCMPVLTQTGGSIRMASGIVWAQAVNVEDALEEEEVKPCSSCHSDETEAWERSLHAPQNAQSTQSAGASCTDCHGEYVRGHPYEELIPLVVDSSNCATCHADTYDQWQHSLHANEGVQCISCHSSHDQELRLTDDKLCSSCHLESINDAMHTAHWQSDVTCTNCHLTDSVGGHSIASSDPVMSTALAPTHDFVTVSGAKCLDCHRNDVNAQAASPTSAPQAAPQSPQLVSELQSAQKSNQFLAMLSTINLGFGVGIGGILGMIFVLVFATISKRSDKA